MEIDDDLVRARLLVDRRHLHPGGYVHGGAWVAFADTVAAWGTMRNLPAGTGFTTVELKTNVFASGHPGDELVALGEPLHLRARTQVWEARIHKGGASNREELGAAEPACPVIWVPDEAVLAGERPAPPVVELSDEDPCLITFTSGTVGEAKGVLHGQRYLEGQRVQAEHWLAPELGD